MRLSICMIVKNEADMLPLFLQHAAGLWDELVAVDTGSSDATVELLQAAGARVLHQPWTGDFAAARNHSLAAASGDWVLVLDPDERCSPEFVAAARALLDRTDVGAATIRMQNMREDGHIHEANLLRLFRRHDTVRFQYAIHEDVTASVMARLRATGQSLVHLHGPVLHLGYARGHAQSRGKKERDVGLIQATLSAAPDHIYLHFKLLEQARFWDDPALWRASAPAAQAAYLRVAHLAHGPWLGEMLVMVAEGLHPNDPQAALATLDALAAAGAGLDESPALACKRGDLLELMGRLSESAQAFEHALVATGPVVNQQLALTRPRMGLVRLAIAAGDLVQARAQLAVVLEHEPSDPEAVFVSNFLSGMKAAP